MARPFKICPDCGAHLDASEPCDCKDAIEREPPKPRERLKLLAVCREADKESGRVSVYPLDLEITSEILASLKMRAQFNPELRYFTTTTARWDRYGEVMAGTHTFKKPFEYAGETYTTLTFDFEKMTGRDMVSIETEMQMNNEYCLAPEVSRSFQAKMAAKAAGIGSDVLDAMPIKDFNRITNAARSFLIDTGY